MPAYQKTIKNADHQQQARQQKQKEPQSQKANPLQVLQAPDTMQPEEFLAAQKDYGNQVVQRALDAGRESGKITDRNGNLREDISLSIQQARGSGSTLTPDIQKDMKQRLGHQFEHVRLHTDSHADKLARKMNARAFTIGSDIFFKNGVYAPAAEKGRETLIHELTHVVQQSSGGKGVGGRLKLGSPDTAQEKEADRKGKLGSRSGPNATTGSVQREIQEDEELQMQRDNDFRVHSAPAGNLQRSVDEEDEIQTQEDEDELQFQREPSALIQRAPEEEDEIQMQEDEEEIQTQQDAGGTVQRGLLDWFKKKKGEIPKAPEFKPDTKPVKSRGKPLTEKGQKVLSQIKQTKPTGGSMQEQLAEKRKQMGLDETSSPQAKAHVKARLSKIDFNQKHRFKQVTSTGVDSNKLKSGSEQGRLMGILKDPKSSPEQMKEAEDQLREFHKQGAFKKNPATVALEQRKKALKIAATKGDKDAMEKYRKENPSFSTKAKGAAGKAMDFYGKHQETFGKAFGVIGKLFGSGGKDKDDDKEKGEAKGGGGGGGDGGYSIISKLLEENQKLREQLKAQK